jgi:hypothetical protein
MLRMQNLTRRIRFRETAAGMPTLVEIHRLGTSALPSRCFSEDGKKGNAMKLNLRTSALAAAVLGAAFLPGPTLALDDDVDVDAGADVEIDRDRPGLLPGEPLNDPEADVHVDTPDADADTYVEKDDDEADVDIEAETD